MMSTNLPRATLFCMLAVSSAAGQSVAVRDIHDQVQVGQTIRVRAHVNYHHCGTVIPTNIRTVQAPRHGTLEVRDMDVLLTDPELGSGSKCAGFHGMGKAVYYTRTSPGIDKFRYDSRSGNGVVHIIGTVE